MNRRQFLVLSAASAGTVIFAGCTGGRAGNTQAVSKSANLLRVHQSQNGLSFTLRRLSRPAMR